MADNVTESAHPGLLSKLGHTAWQGLKSAAIGITVGAATGAILGEVTDQLLPEGEKLDGLVNKTVDGQVDKTLAAVPEQVPVDVSGAKDALLKGAHTNTDTAIDNVIQKVNIEALSADGTTPEGANIQANAERAAQLLDIDGRNMAHDTINKAAAQLPNKVDVPTAPLKDAINASRGTIKETLLSEIRPVRESLHTALPLGGAAAGGAIGVTAGAVYGLGKGAVESLTATRPVLGNHTEKLAQESANTQEQGRNT